MKPKVTVFEDPCPNSGHSMQEFIEKLNNKSTKRCEDEPIKL